MIRIRTIRRTIGHGDRNIAVPYGTLVELDTRHGTLVALEGAVE